MNIIDYIKWRGDITFKIDPFNEVDNVVISQMIYTCFDDSISSREKLTIEQLATRFFKKHSEKELMKSKSFIATAYLTLKEMAIAPRYKDLQIHDFVSIINEKTTEQFCAAQIDLDPKTTYVVFRGTDDTLLGWQEDFKISYELTAAQREATKYLNNVKAKNIIVGGHSKGGMLAVHAAASCHSRIQNKISTIYSNDGPGLNFGFSDREGYNRIRTKIIKIIPKDDVFGVIYDNKGVKKIVVDSTQYYMLQHDANSWLVERNRFVQHEQLKSSKNLDKELNRFLSTTNNYEKMNFTNNIFKALKKAGIKNVSEFQTGGIQVLRNCVKEMSLINEEAKGTANKFIEMSKRLVSMGMVDTGQDVLKLGSDTISSIGHSLKETIKEKIGKKK